MEITEKITSQSQNCCCKANEKFEIDDVVEQAYRQGYQKGYQDADKSITIQNLRKIANHYGFTSQADMLCEEAGEFITARNKIRRGVFEALMLRDHDNANNDIIDDLKTTIHEQAKKIKSLEKQLEAERESNKKLREAVLRQSIDNYEYD